MLQRLPLFLLVDASDSMERCHADTLNRALRMVINRISEDLYAVESVVISVIVFSGKSQVNVLHRFSYAYHCGFSDISSLGGAADYGAGFGALFREMTDGVVRPSGSAPGDLRPLVFFFTAGSSPGTAGQGLSDRAAQDLRRNADVFSFVLSGKSDNSWSSRYSDRVYNIGDDAAPLESLLSKISSYVLKSSRAAVRQGFLSMMLSSENDYPGGGREEQSLPNGRERPESPGRARRYKSFLPYFFAGSSYTAMPELVTAMLLRPREGIRDIRSGNLARHFGLFDRYTEALCGKAARELAEARDPVSERNIFCRLMYELAPEVKSLFAGGREISGLTELGEYALNAAAAGNESLCREIRLLQDFLEYYAVSVIKSDAAAHILRTARELATRMHYPDTRYCWILGYAFSEKRSLRVHDKVFGSPAEFWYFLEDLKKRQGFSACEGFIAECRDDLTFFAAAIPERSAKRLLQGILGNAGKAVFGDGELEFRDAAAFDDFISKLLQGGKAYRLKAIFENYGPALRQVADEVWHSASYYSLKRTVNSFVAYEEHLFVSPEALRDYLSDILVRNQDSPEFLREYAKIHDQALAHLETHPEFRETASRLRSFRNFGKSRRGSVTAHTITVNDVRYPRMLMKGDVISFGRYPCDRDGSLAPLEWQVLEVSSGEALLITRCCIDCRQYHHRGEDITWEDCDLRKWLNGDFLRTAFSETEIRRILVSSLKNAGNPQYAAPGGNGTMDRIFCLSTEEALRYLGDKAERVCRATPYAREKGVFTSNYSGGAHFWLRSPGHYQTNAAVVMADGELNYYGDGVFSVCNAVRPALRISAEL